MATTPPSDRRPATARLLPTTSRARTFRGAGGLALAGDLTGPEDGPTVVLLHGGGQTRHAWRHAAGEFGARGYHTLTLDARGHGDSDWDPAGRYSVEALRADL